MRPLPALTLLLAGTLSAQSVLTTSFNANHHLGTLDGGVYFDLTVHHELHLDQIDLNLLAPAQTPGSLEVFVRPGTWFGHVEEQGDWTEAARGAFVATGPYQPTPCILDASIGLAPGTYGIALHLNGAMPLYTTSFSPQTFANADLLLVGGGSAVSFLDSAPFYYRVFSGALHYATGGGPYSTASAQTFGAGCQRGARSFYELFAAGNVDLAHQRVILTMNGTGGYDVVRGPAPAVTLPANATNLALTRGQFVHVPLSAPLPILGGHTSSLLVLADGRVMLSGLGLLGTGTLPPTATQLLSSLPTVAALWMDHAPAGSGNVYSAIDPLSGAVTITWWNVPTFGAPAGGNTFSFTARPNGTLEVRWNAIDNPTQPGAIGFGAGSAALDPGPIDLSAASAFATQHDDRGLSLEPIGRPAIGRTTRLVLFDLPASTGYAAMMFGWTAIPGGVDLGGLGAPGCSLYLNPGAADWSGLGAAQAANVTLPPTPALLGLRFHAQAAAWAPGRNALGVVSSNAVTLLVGSV